MEHRFRNYMDRCSGGQSYITVDKKGKVSLRSYKALQSLGEADWKSINPPKRLNHREFRFWVNRSTGKCLAVFEEKTDKRTVGVSECKLDGSNTSSLPFASTITKPSALVVFTTSDVQKNNSSHNSTSRLHAVLCTYALNLSLKKLSCFHDRDVPSFACVE